MNKIKKITFRLFSVPLLEVINNQNLPTDDRIVRFFFLKEEYEAAYKNEKYLSLYAYKYDDIDTNYENNYEKLLVEKDIMPNSWTNYFWSKTHSPFKNLYKDEKIYYADLRIRYIDLYCFYIKKWTNKIVNKFKNVFRAVISK